MSVKGIVTYRSAAGSRITTKDDKIYPGVLRKRLKKEGLYAGDFVEGEIVDDSFVIEKISKRKNLLKRPPVANVDTVLIVMAAKNPDFDTFLLDNFLAVYEFLGIDPVIVINKIDLLEDMGKISATEKIYRDLGYKILKTSAKKGVEEIEPFINSDITILSGPSGVGKSSILSSLLGLDIKTNEVSEKLKRGRHTTTAVTLYRFRDGFIADTPGFSRVEATYFMDKREIRLYFREFRNYRCRFVDCTHTNEPGCAVKEAVLNGEIHCGRFKNYLKIMNFYWEELSSLCDNALVV